MSAFDLVLSETVAAVESSPLAAFLRAVTIIRDLRGRVRLALDFKKDASGKDQLPPQAAWITDRAALEADLKRRLGDYWGEQLWREGDRKDEAFRALRSAIEQERQHFAPDQAALSWYKLERLYAKASWFRQTMPPWTLASPTDPAIISFYSYKGGVGRTLTLAAVALLLAQANRRVVILDLDLEAPGIGSVFLRGVPPPDDGIVDYLIEWQLCGRRPRTLAPFVAIQTDPQLVGSQPVRVITAGRVDANYLEKIARLDFDTALSSGGSGLTELLKQVRDEYQPDFILLDVRSGLHDLGGLSLNGLSHLDVLFGREATQAWDGLAVVLALLGAAQPRQEVLLVHAQVPKTSVDPDAHNRFRARSYDLFHDNYYAPTEQMPDLANPDAPYGLALPFKDELQMQRDLAAPEVLGQLLHPQGGYFELAKIIGTYLARGTVAP